MTFLNPGYAPWLMVAALPVLLHLFFRRTPRRAALPTLRFLQAALAAQSRARRVRRPLLLAVRVAALAALALAFLKPVVPAFVGGLGAPRSVVIVLDTSASMQYAVGGVRSFDRARALALRTLDGLRAGDRANVILAGEMPRPVAPRPTDDIGALRDALRNAAPRPEGCAAGAALAVAVSQLPARGGELFIVSDFQRTAWAAAGLGALPPGVRVVVLPTDGQDRPNAGVMSVGVRPSAPRPGDDVAVTAMVWNGSPTRRRLAVRLWLDGAGERTVIVSAPRYAAAAASALFACPSAGPRAYGAGVEPDGLAADDTRTAGIVVGRSTPVVLVSDAAASGASGAGYLARALNPTPDRPGGARVRRLRPSVVSAGALRGTVAAFVADVRTWPGAAGRSLDAYVRAGGTAVVFAGAGTPAELAAPFDAARPRVEGRLGAVEPGSALLRGLDAEQGGDLGAARLTHLPAPASAGDIEVAARFTDGTPAVVVRDAGKGRLVVCNFAPGPRDGDLFRQPIFPPLAQELLAAAAGPPRVGGLPGEETDLRALAPAEVAAALAGRGAVAAGSGQASAVAQLGRDRPLWPYCLWTSLVLLVVELALSSARPSWLRAGRPAA